MSFPSRSRVRKLERDLFERQQSSIREILGPTSKALARYEAEYLAATSLRFRAATRNQLRARVAVSDIAFVGDYHTLPAAQDAFGVLARNAARTGRPLVLALELFESRFQGVLDAFASGALSVDALLRRTGVDLAATGGSRSAFARLLENARSLRAELLGIDLCAQGPKRIERRDAHAAQKIAERSLAADRPLILALVGQFHVAPGHLPSEVRARVGDARRLLVVYQNPERVWFRARARPAPMPEAVALEDGSFALMHSAPTVCQQSFLDAVEVDEDDQVLSSHAFADAASAIARAVRIDCGAAARDVVVLDSASRPAAEGHLASGRISRREFEVIRHAALSRQSCFLPRARVVYVGRQSMADVAEEAAHFVRHLCVGDAMTRSRRRSEAFHARCLEEALGFLGSILVQPGRRVTPLREWARIYRSNAPERELAAYVLAHKAAEKEGAFDGDLIPSDDETFHAVSHALGYLLGDALAEAGLSRAELTRLFRDPFDAPLDRYLELWARYGTSSSRTISKRAA